jgi:hypothetical protein
MKIRKLLYTKYFIFFIAYILTGSFANAQYNNGSSLKRWSLFGAMSLNNQTLNDAGISAPINYAYNAVNNNVLKPGYSGGFRYDITLDEKYNYSLIFGINRVSTGTAYTNKYALTPFIEDFTHYKAENQFTTLSFAAHYKILLPVNEMSDYKFYAVFGPSIDYKISNMNQEQLVNAAGNRAFINGDIGAEFNNKDYYVLYAHYKLGKNLSNSAVSVQMNRFELGMALKLIDIF